jgi:hypothetical protein
MLDYVYLLRNCKSAKTGGPLGESTVFNYFQDDGFLNDRGIAVCCERDWVGRKWPIKIDKRNKNKKYSTYLEEEITALLRSPTASRRP